MTAHERSKTIEIMDDEMEEVELPKTPKAPQHLTRRAEFLQNEKKKIMNTAKPRKIPNRLDLTFIWINYFLNDLADSIETYKKLFEEIHGFEEKDN